MVERLYPALKSRMWNRTRRKKLYNNCLLQHDRRSSARSWTPGAPAAGYKDTSVNMISLARSLSITKTELSRYLSVCYNTTFRIRLAEVRFEAAKRMILEHPDYSNDVISAECGFSSRSYLYRMFKEKEGCSPTAWKEKKIVKKIRSRCLLPPKETPFLVGNGHLRRGSGHFD